MVNRKESEELFIYWARKEYPAYDSIVQHCVGIMHRDDVSRHVEIAKDIAKSMYSNDLGIDLDYGWEIDDMATIMSSQSDSLQDTESFAHTILWDLFQRLSAEEVNELKQELVKEKLKC